MPLTKMPADGSPARSEVASADRPRSAAPTGATDGLPGAPGAARAPLVVIEAGRAARGLGLADLWTHRELMYFLVWRDLKVRYKQTVLGVGWAVLQPLLTMVLFTLVFGRLGGIQQRVAVPYPVFAYAGILLWSFFSSAVMQG